MRRSYQTIIISISFGKHCLELTENSYTFNQSREHFALCNSLLGKSRPEVHHRLHQLLLADGPVVVVVEDPEGGLHIIHLVTALPEELDTNFYEVVPRHQALPVTVCLGQDVRLEDENKSPSGQTVKCGEKTINKIYILGGI